MQSTTGPTKDEMLLEAKRKRLETKRIRNIKKKDIKRARNNDRDNKNAFSTKMFEEMHSEQKIVEEIVEEITEEITEK
jgi:hypothetical protein